MGTYISIAHLRKYLTIKQQMLELLKELRINYDTKMSFISAMTKIFCQLKLYIVLLQNVGIVDGNVTCNAKVIILS